MSKTTWLVAALLLCMTPLASASVTIELDQAYTGDTPAGTAPWLTLFFENIALDTVRLTVTANLQDADEFISNVYFNYAGADPTDLSFAFVSGVNASVAAGLDAFTAAGNGNYDILIPYDFAPPPVRFNGSDQSVFDITGVGIDETDFNVLAVGNKIFTAAAHVQGTAGRFGSGHIAPSEIIPEPASLAIWGCIALMGIPYGVYRRRQVTKA
jgi:hypothetical protein